MQPWEQEIKLKLAEQELNILKSTDEDLFNKLVDKLEKAEALSTIEKAYADKQVDFDTLLKARTSAGVYANTSENRKKGIVGAKYKGGMGSKEDEKGSKSKPKIAANKEDIKWEKSPYGGEVAQYKMGTIRRGENDSGKIVYSIEMGVSGTKNSIVQNVDSLEDAINRIDNKGFKKN